MTGNGLLQLVLFLVILLALTKPLGLYMARVYEGRAPGLGSLLGRLERLVYRLSGVQPDREMGWKTYTFAMLLFNFAGLLVVYLLQRLQGVLPLNPQGLGAVTPDSSFNTAVSFATNTNWQGYGGEMTMSYLTQMLGLTVQNFVSAAAGMATLAAFVRGFSRRSAETIGNFWVDLLRTTLYILLPLSFVLALILVSQGVVQTFGQYATITVVQPTQYDVPETDKEGKPILDEKDQPRMTKATLAEQVLAVGPAASQIAIKQLGTNGGGFFNVNSAHPLENPTPLSNFFELLAILVISAALCYTFGAMVGDTRQGWAVLAAMTVVFVGLLIVCVVAEQRGATLGWLGVDHGASDLQAGGNMEGKEVRHGIATSALWATATTAASNGSVNSMHDSYTPIGGLVPMWLMQLGEVIYGGVGSGLYGMLVFAIIAVFAAGLMVGRTPEYLGKKIEAYEMKMASLVILLPPAAVLIGAAAAVFDPAARASMQDAGPHGLSEVLYAFSSMGNNNGSAFAGYSANIPYVNTTGGLAMLIARYWLAIPSLAIAGSLARKKTVPPGPGTLPTHTPLFVVLLIGVVVLVGALAFLPALALGPIVEHLLMTSAK
ncbi:MAG TPA: potassium-transporting ATPase subunit KdpA [Methylomirabilota bacterium]|jgi:K+-transporting ATPase ATPase A chain|nr:potassium-transporting ATPase subunit KdpA [Methylomirabilota bacterium]